MAQRWRCLCAYDGTGFAGWQSQSGGGAVQDAIEAALAAVFKSPVRIHGSGRTDAGVHARGQVFHFDAAWRHGPLKLAAALRTGLPPQIQLRSVRAARPDFHARFSAKGKLYLYEIRLGDADPFTRPFCWPLFRPLDLAAMEDAAARLRGRHDFRAFSARRGPGEEQTVRDLRRLELSRRGRRLRIAAEADGFLYKMVRSLVGALVAVGEGRIAPAQITEMLQGRGRTPRLEVAPAQGLFLERVFY
ncbi:MAG TPA: tRNA pseudouridine(38-40) synthase TruA [Opitutaceae bacterium]|nr:tRNA pseudouridine(38-40) synthase TruA [Opitutaceae bacterium]